MALRLPPDFDLQMLLLVEDMSEPKDRFIQLVSRFVGDRTFNPLVHANSARGMADPAVHYDPIENPSDVEESCYLNHRAIESGGRGYVSPNFSAAAVLAYVGDSRHQRPLSTLARVEAWEGIGFVSVLFGWLLIDVASKPEPWNSPGFKPSPALYYDPRNPTLIKDMVNEYMREVAALARELWELWEPQVGFLGTMWYPRDRPAYVRGKRLERISWLTGFGPKYGAVYGRDFLLGLPGFLNEELEGGTILYQATSDFVISDGASDPSEDLLGYLRNHSRLQGTTLSLEPCVFPPGADS